MKALAMDFFMKIWPTQKSDFNNLSANLSMDVDDNSWIYTFTISLTLNVWQHIRFERILYDILGTNMVFRQYEPKWIFMSAIKYVFKHNYHKKRYSISLLEGASPDCPFVWNLFYTLDKQKASRPCVIADGCSANVPPHNISGNTDNLKFSALYGVSCVLITNSPTWTLFHRLQYESEL